MPASRGWLSLSISFGLVVAVLLIIAVFIILRSPGARGSAPAIGVATSLTPMK